MPRFLTIALLSFSCLLIQGKHAFSNPGRYDTILLGGIIVDKDTFGMAYIPEVLVYGYMSPERRAELAKLRYNVLKVYPYAITAAYILDKVDREMTLRNKKKDRKAYIKATEKEMNARFKNELKNLTITQGKILVKLINRETGQDCYELIKQLKGGLNARIYQTTAFFFDNNLKQQYDPYGEDRDIEMIVRELEAKNYFLYQKRQLTQKTLQ